MDCPGRLRFHRRLLRWFSTLHLGVLGLLPVALTWQEAESDSQTPGYYYLAQRVFCGEGDDLLPEHTRSGGRILLPSLTSVAALVPPASAGLSALLVMAVEGREQVDINAGLLYIPRQRVPVCCGPGAARRHYRR